MNEYAQRVKSLSWIVALSMAAAAQASTTSGNCDAYAADVKQELAAMSAAPAVAGAALTSDVVYRLELRAQEDFEFAVPPERRQLDDGAYAGLARFSVPAAGRWRVSLGGASWIDVVDGGGQLVTAGRFEGHPECSVLRKLVEFPLDAGQTYTLQLSGGTEPVVNLLISGPLPDTP